MLGVIATHSGMLMAMWIVLIAIGVDILVHLVTALRGRADLDDLAKAVTRPVLLDLLPLILLSLLTALDGTHILVLIWYYVAAVLIVIRTLLHLSKLLKR